MTNEQAKGNQEAKPKTQSKESNAPHDSTDAPHDSIDASHDSIDMNIPPLVIPEETQQEAPTIKPIKKSRVNEEIASLKGEMEKMEKEYEELKDKYLMALADRENMTKKMQKERISSSQLAKKSILLEILPALDQFHVGMQFASSSTNQETKNLAIGFAMVEQSFKQFLSQYNVHTFSSLGEKFNHTFHHAIGVIETDTAEPGTILKEHLIGYKIGTEILRPARVEVAEPPKSIDEASDQKEVLEEPTIEEQK